MDFIYNGHNNKSGVYKITNKVNGKIYIGSAKLFKVRANRHISSLKKNKHQNKHLQASFNKYGEGAFLFEVLEVVLGDKTARTTKEQEYIDEQMELENWENCFNFKKKTVEKERSCYSNTPEETRKLISENSKVMWTNPAIREKILKNKGVVQQSDEYKKNCSVAQKKNWTKDPERREKMSARIKEEFANGSRDHVVETLKASQSKGRVTFKERMKNDPDFKKKYQKTGKEKVKKIQERYKQDPKFRKEMDACSRKNIVAFNKNRVLTKKPDLVGPDGKIYKNIYNLSAFAKEHNLDPSCLYKLTKEKLKKHKGWKLL